MVLPSLTLFVSPDAGLPWWGCSSRLDWRLSDQLAVREEQVKSYEEIMEILEAYDLTRSFRDAAELAGCSHHTVAAYVARRDAGELPAPSQRVERSKLVDPFLAKVEEWVDHSEGKVRADVVFERLGPLGVRGFGADGAPSGRFGEGQLAGREAAGVSALDHRAGDVGAVGLGSRPCRLWPSDPVVVRLVGVVPFPGGVPDVG